jgi:YrbI family 3-deoxy-D-manno-octulosonate 8-phosphate phosphatase
LSKPLPGINAIHTVAFDFDGVFTDNKVWIDQNGHESVRCDRGDGLAFDLVRAYQQQYNLTIKFFILSKEKNPVVIARARKLKLDCHHGVTNKLTFMRKYLENRYPSEIDHFSGVVYLGNDLNDLSLMRQVGYAVAPADAHAKVRQIADLVLQQKGGEGFVRAFIELLLGINTLKENQIHELVSNC